MYDVYDEQINMWCIFSA